MKIKLAFLIVLPFCLSGCLSWNIDKQATVNAAAAGAGAAAVNAVANAVTNNNNNNTPPADTKPKEEPRKGYVPDPNNPLSGPKITDSIQSNDPAYAPVYPDGVTAAQAPTGGIYKTSMGDVILGNQKASKVGDVLTINLNENTTSTKANTAAITKTASATIPNPKVLGQTLRMDTDVPAQTTNFSGNASANQNNTLAGTITVTVYKVYPNGLLAVRGEKWLKLNQGSEYLRFSGVVREQDITPDNTVESARVADARITYSGTGEVAAGSEQGWVSRLLNSRAMPN